MKLKIKTETTTEVEIELPVYRKVACFFYKVYSNEHCIQILDSCSNSGITLAHAELAWHLSGGTDCTKEEFDQAFDKVFKELSDLIK